MEKNGGEKQWDVFVSYARKDCEWVRALAENLHNSDLDVFLDEWEIGPGDVVLHKIDEGLRKSRNGIVVVTPTALSRPWVLEEYAAMARMAVENAKRLVPVLLADADMPAILANRHWVDFRDAHGPEYEKKMEELVRALKGQGPQGPPARTGKIRPAPGDAFHPEGPIVRRLRIGKDKVSFSGGYMEAAHEPRGLGHEDEQRLYELDKARRRAVPEDTHVHRPGAARDGSIPDPGSPVYGAIMAAGAALGRAFLQGEAGDAIRKAARQAASLNVSLRIALAIDDPDLANLPWESLRIPEKDGSPGKPLALHPNIRLYRAGKQDGPATAFEIPGPLRILAVVGSPESQNQRGELLDMELETMRILDAVEKAAGRGDAHVEILENGSLKAIRGALASMRYHVLHISCHARPGYLVLETEDGKEDEVSAERLCDEILAPDRGVPLTVLAGCSTGLGGTEGEKQLSSIAESLMDRGAPCVVAMNAPVSDRYATEFGGLLYKYLASAQRPDPLSAFFEARLGVEKMRQDETAPQEKAALADWAAPALYVRAKPLDLYDPRAPRETIETRTEPSLTPGVCVLGPGHFVGRRRDLRLLFRAMENPERAGVVAHGIGGCGKSSLAARLFQRLSKDGWTVASVAGHTDVEAILGEIGSRLFGYCIENNLDEKHPLRQFSVVAQEKKFDWHQRFEQLLRQVFPGLKMAFLLDNFEDNLTKDRTVDNEGLKADLGELLSLWARSAGKTRMVFTCRYPFQLPDEAETLLEHWHVGPLSFVETRKLAWRLPALKALDKSELQRAYESVGGHPRALEYLEALLRGGEARFPHVEKKLKDAIRKKEGVDDPGKWRKDAAGNLDRALAETVTLAADDVLLDGLLEMIEKVPPARTLLFGASVYRLPVDLDGLLWQIGREIQVEPDPERDARMQAAMESINRDFHSVFQGNRTEF